MSFFFISLKLYLSNNSINTKMTRKIYIFGLFLMLCTTLVASDEPAPPVQSQTTSLKALIDSIESVKGEVSSIKRDIYELRIQLNTRFDTMYRNLLIYLTAFNLALFSLLRLLERFWGWIMFKRTKRRADKLHEKMIRSVAVGNAQLGKVNQQLILMKKELDIIQGQIREHKLPVVEEKKKKTTIWDRVKQIVTGGGK